MDEKFSTNVRRSARYNVCHADDDQSSRIATASDKANPPSRKSSRTLTLPRKREPIHAPSNLENVKSIDRGADGKAGSKHSAVNHTAMRLDIKRPAKKGERAPLGLHVTVHWRKPRMCD